jgi:hypothetical protein
MFETSKISIALAVCWLQLASPQTPITKKPPTSLGDLRRDNVPGEKLNFLQETKIDFRFAAFQLVKSSIAMCVATCLAVNNRDTTCEYDAKTGKGQKLHLFFIALA